MNKKTKEEEAQQKKKKSLAVLSPFQVSKGDNAPSPTYLYSLLEGSLHPPSHPPDFQGVSKLPIR
jgi:hypothetical protein